MKGYWKGKKFSASHRKNLSIARKKRVREKHPRWKGGRTVNNDGYIMLWTPNGMKSEHRMKMEKKLKRKLKSSEIVHHKNEKKTDNRLCNLAIMTKSEHMSHHYREELKFKKGHKYYGANPNK